MVKYQQGKYDESFELYQQVLTLQRKSFFYGDLDTVRILNGIGTAQLHGKDNYDQALDYHQQALTILITKYPSDTARIAVTLSYIGDIARKQLKNDVALILYQHTLKM